MKSTQDYTFEVSISYQSFDHKPNRGTEIPKLTFAKQTINVNGFLQYLLAGHCYAPIFSSDEFTMSGKKDCNYRYSYFVSIDIDHTDVEMNAMVDKLAYKPTIAYTSCSNGLGGKFSYRLIYCFENRIEGTKEYYNQVYSILDVNGLSVNDIDKRSLKASQYYNGNGTGTFDFTTNDIVYSKEDLKAYYTDYFKTHHKDSTKSINENHTHTTPYNIHLNDTFNSTEFAHDYWNMRMEDVLSKYVDVYPNLEHTPLPDVDDDTPYIIYPTGYIEIRRWWRKRLDGKPIKIKDGEGRRRKLFINGIIRRLINPQITFDNLLYNLLYETVYYISNFDAENIIDKKVIYNIATDVMQKDLVDYEHLRHMPHKTYTTNPNYCVQHNISRNALKGTVGKMIRSQKIGELYDCTMTDKENMEVMKTNGLDISLITLKRWRKENGIAKYKKEKA